MYKHVHTWSYKLLMTENSCSWHWVSISYQLNANLSINPLIDGDDFLILLFGTIVTRFMYKCWVYSSMNDAELMWIMVLFSCILERVVCRISFLFGLYDYLNSFSSLKGLPQRISKCTLIWIYSLCWDYLCFS